MKSRLIAVVIHKRFIYGKFDSASLPPFTNGEVDMSLSLLPDARTLVTTMQSQTDIEKGHYYGDSALNNRSLI